MAADDCILPWEGTRYGRPLETFKESYASEDGFEKMVRRVAEIEKTLGIYDLSRFTPSV